MISNKQSGVTLIEVLVTLFIMAIGLLGLAGLQSTTMKDGVDTSKRSQIMWLVSELVERMRANPDGQATGYTTAATGLSCNTTPAIQCSDNGAGSAAANCTPNEMATFDVWEVFCGRTETDVIANATDSLNLTALNISCGAATCTPTSDFTISISWLAQPVGDSRLLSTSQIAANNTQSIIMGNIRL